MHLYLYFLGFLLLVTNGLCAQQIIPIKNGSLEGYPMYSTEIEDWQNCNKQEETPPDLHAAFTYHFEVNNAPAHGLSFLGMVTRDNATNEQISQQLASSLDSTTTYAIALSLCQSNSYNSISRANGRFSSFTKPIQLRIYGSNQACAKGEVLAESDLITHPDWKGYSFTFKPSKSWKYLILSAYDANATSVAVNGHILVDNISNLIPIDRPILPTPSIDNTFELAKDFPTLESCVTKGSARLVVDGLLQVSAMVELQTEVLPFENYTIEIVVNNQVRSLRQLMKRQSISVFRDYNRFVVRKMKAKDYSNDWLFENDLYKVRLIPR